VKQAAGPDEERLAHGRQAAWLRVYLGYAPGVGKTYAMLHEGRRRRDRGADVVVGWVQTYDRPHTVAAVGDLEIVPPRAMDYRGQLLHEMDVDVEHRRVALRLGANEVLVPYFLEQCSGFAVAHGLCVQRVVWIEGMIWGNKNGPANYSRGRPGFVCSRDLRACQLVASRSKSRNKSKELILGAEVHHAANVFGVKQNCN